MERIGHLSQRRYQALVERMRKHVQAHTASQFAFGDAALEIEPIRPHRGGNAGVYETLRAFADDIGVEFHTLLEYRKVAAAWPEKYRSPDAPWSVHQRLAPLPDRFEVIKHPPFNERLGRPAWTVSAAERAAGRVPHQPPAPERFEEKIARVHKLTQDEGVASAVASQLLRRPEVAGRVLADPQARRQLYRAQADHDQQVHDAARDRTPAIRHVEHSLHFFDLLTVGQAFIRDLKRLIPQLQEDPLTSTEREPAVSMLDQAESAVNYCRAVINAGDFHESVAKLLKEEGPP